MDTLPVVSGKYPRQLSKSISKTKDDAPLRTGLLPPPKGIGFPPKLCWRYFLWIIRFLKINKSKKQVGYLFRITYLFLISRLWQSRYKWIVCFAGGRCKGTYRFHIAGFQTCKRAQTQGAASAALFSWSETLSTKCCSPLAFTFRPRNSNFFGQNH